MLKATLLAVAVWMALCNSSRLLLQTVAPAQPSTTSGIPPAPPTPVQPPPQQPQPIQPQPTPYNPYAQQPQQPQQPAYNPYGQQQYNPYGQQYNPYGAPGGINMNNPYCNPYSGMYDAQDCYQYSFMYQQYQPQPVPAPPTAPYNPYAQQQSTYNPYGQQYNAYGGGNGINMNNPYCNPYSGMYDAQDCYQYSYLYQQYQPPTTGNTAASPYGQQYNQYNQQPGTGGASSFGQQTNPIINMNNPYCNPYSGSYDIQDCYQTSFGFSI